jgi:tetrachlorobenzoquinone reductase
VADDFGISVRVAAIRYEAAGVYSFVLQRVDGANFPNVDPGAHVDLRLPNGVERSYSLSNGQGDQGSYRITVARNPQSTGGSAVLHDVIRPGDVIAMREPHNNFPLVSDSAFSMFIAGGIGITPFIPMAAALNAAGKPWRLLYTVKCPDQAAFLAETQALAEAGQGEVARFFTGETGGRRLDIAQTLADLPPGAHVYCCGPARMLMAFRQAAAERGIDGARVHYEYFESDARVAAEGGFTVVLQRSGKEIQVEPGQTILEAVEAAGCEVPYSCREGICGLCETRVLEGVPDHRDMLFSEEERRTASTMMICCSGSKSDRLVLVL